MRSNKWKTWRRLKSFFLANLSHEIRTPLNSILGFSDVLHDMLEPENRRFVEHITKSGEELLEIIDRILQLSKFQAGDIKALSGVFEPRSRLLALEKEVNKIQQEIEFFVQDTGIGIHEVNVSHSGSRSITKVLNKKNTTSTGESGFHASFLSDH